MLRQVNTGGQAGVEQAAWASARRAGLATGGYMPAGFVIEDGPAPRIGALYNAIAFPLGKVQRLRANLRRADALLWLGEPDDPAGRVTLAAARELGKPALTARPGTTTPAEVAHWLEVFDVETLLVAGPPASRAPDLAAQAGPLLDRTFVRLARGPSTG